MRALVAVSIAVISAAFPSVSAGQAPESGSPPIDLVDIGLGLTSGLMFLAPELLDLDPEPLNCLPCSRSEVPRFERWAIRSPVGGVSTASDIAVTALALGAWLEIGVHRRDWHALKRSGHSAALAFGAATLLKDLVGRNRPFVYATDVVGDVSDPDLQRSLPSAHTAVAAALATDFLRYRASLTGTPPWRDPLSLAVLATATGVGVMRVAAGRHFPSDVLAGAAVGIVASLVVYEVRF